MDCIFFYSSFNVLLFPPIWNVKMILIQMSKQDSNNPSMLPQQFHWLGPKHSDACWVMEQPLRQTTILPLVVE